VSVIAEKGKELNQMKVNYKSIKQLQRELDEIEKLK